jgi:quinol-cytochrome oxidoreductase complex cytochrome b subunit
MPKEHAEFKLRKPKDRDQQHSFVLFADIYTMKKSLLMIFVIIATAEICLAAPVANDVGKAGDYDFDRPEEDPSSFVYQEMILPDWKTLPKEWFGPGYVWDTKGFPRRAEKPRSQKEDTKSAATAPRKHKTQQV